jgi:hypothetical protein
MARTLGVRASSNGNWYQLNPVQADEDTPLPSITDISVQNLSSEDNLYVSSSPDWDTVGIVIKPGQIVSFEGMSTTMQLWVNDDGNNIEMAIMKIER